MATAKLSAVPPFPERVRAGEKAGQSGVGNPAQRHRGNPRACGDGSLSHSWVLIG